MSALSPQMCKEAAELANSLELLTLYSIRIVLGIAGCFGPIFLYKKKGTSWIPNPNAKILYLAHLYFAFHVSFFFTLMYLFQLIRCLLVTDDPCFYVLDARTACLIRLIPGVGIHCQSFSMLTFAIERAISTRFTRKYEKITTSYLGVFLIALAAAAAVTLDFFAMFYPISSETFVSVLTSKNAQNMHVYGLINYIPLSVELTTITIFILTYSVNVRKSRTVEDSASGSARLGSQYQISENKKVIRALLPCFLTHFLLNVISYGVLALLPLFFRMSLVANSICVEIVSQAMTYSVLLPAIVLWQTRRTEQMKIPSADMAGIIYFQQLHQLFNQ